MPRILVIGGGPGGYTAAFAAAKAGADVVLVEAGPMGGTCLNWGCVPTKTLRASADVLELAQRCAEFGIEGVGEACVNMAAVVARKNRVTALLRGGLEKTCATLKVRLVRGKAQLLGGTRVRVALADGGEERLEAESIILATGSRSLDLPSLPLDHTHILSSDDALELEAVPQRLVIVGGGVIGAELAFIYQSFGAKVTVVEGRERLLPLPSVDEEVSKLLLREAKKRGIRVELERTVTQVAVQPNGSVVASLGIPGGIPGDAANAGAGQVEADAVIVAVGRSTQSAGLGLEAAGVAIDSRGWIIADAAMQTSAPNVYAVGDCLGPARPMLAHVAAVEGLCAAANCLGAEQRMHYDVVPSGIFTSPEVGCVGLAEAQAKANGMAVATSLFHTRELGKAQAMGELAGFCKVVAEAGTGKVLGVHIAGAHATDLIAEATLAISMGATVADIANTIHAHPTLAEGLYEAAHTLATTHC